MAEYVKCLFKSTMQLDKFKPSDIELIKDIFGQHMTPNDMKNSLNIMSDLVRILSSEPDFLSLAFS